MENQLETIEDASLDATIEAAFERDQSASVDKVPRDAGIDKAINDAFAAHEGNDETQAAARSRDENGRFAAKAAADLAKAATDPAIGAAATVADSTTPAAWNKQAALYQSLPPEAKAYIAQREQQVSEGFKRFEGLGEFAQIAESNGGDLRTVLDTVRQLEDLVADDPVQGFEVIMQRSGMDAAAVARAYLGIDENGAPVARETRQQPQIDHRMMQTVQQLQREISDMRVQPIQREIAAFEADPANKHFDRVAGLMATLLQADAGISLKDAYERACYADPQVRAELLQAQNMATATQKASKLAQASQTAQRASRGLNPSSAAQPVNGKPSKMSIDEAINAAYAVHG